MGTIDCDVEGQWVRLWVTRPALSFNTAAIESTLSAAGVATTQVAGIVSFLAGKDYGLFKERLPSTGNAVNVTVEGKSLSFQLGVHFFFTVPSTTANATKAAPAVSSPVAIAAVAAQSAAATSASSISPAQTAASPAKTKASSPTPSAASPSPKAKASGKKGKK